MSLLESLQKILVQDKDDENETVEVMRYIIDNEEEPTAVIFGKFNPWTFSKGHGRLVDFAKEYFKKIVIVSPDRNDIDDIFTNEQKEQIIKKANPDIKFYRIKSSIPIKMFIDLVYKGISRPVFIVGPDRIEDFKKYFIQYSPDNKPNVDPDSPDFGKGEYFYMEDRGDEGTTATKVRQCLIDNNKEEFLELTGENECIWNFLKNMMQVAKNENVKGFDSFYLTEGGNVKVNTTPADRLKISELDIDTYNKIKNEIINGLKDLNTKFKKEYGYSLWPKIDENIKNGDLFSGSARWFFMKTLKEFSIYKKYLGDIDLQLPEYNTGKLKEFLDHHEGETFGNLVYFGRGGHSPIQINTIFKIKDIPYFQNLQIDFEPTVWDERKPSDFAVFSHYSSWDDMSNGIKGVFNKLLLRALIARNKMGDIAVMTKTGKISTSDKFINPSEKSFSVDKGVRSKFEPVYGDDGKQKKIDGKLLYRAIESKLSNYTIDLAEIFKDAYGVEPQEGELEGFYSFVKNLEMMKKYLTKEDCRKVFDRFFGMLWGDEAQVLTPFTVKEDGVNKEDMESKMFAFVKFIDVFPEFKIPREELLKIIKEYYK